VSLANLGRVLLDLDDEAGARDAFRESFGLARRLEGSSRRSGWSSRRRSAMSTSARSVRCARSSGRTLERLLEEGRRLPVDQAIGDGVALTA
jgi:hypothetical protein